jgi:hypothetical protein
MNFEGGNAASPSRRFERINCILRQESLISVPRTSLSATGFIPRLAFLLASVGVKARGLSLGGVVASRNLGLAL